VLYLHACRSVLRNEGHSVPVVIPLCDLTTYCALSVRPSLSAGKNSSSDLNYIFTRNVSLHEEKQIKFWMPSMSGSDRGIFEGFFNTARPVHSSTISSISLEKMTGSSQIFRHHLCIFE